MYLNSWTIYPINKEKSFHAQSMNVISKFDIQILL